MDKRLLIDADSIVYRLAHNLDREDRDSATVEAIPGEFTGSTENRYTQCIQETIDYWMDINKANSYEFHLTAGTRTSKLLADIYAIYDTVGVNVRPCFRYEISTVLPNVYKSNRKYKDVSKHWEPLLICMAKEFNTFCHDYVEADDVVVLRKKEYPEWLLCAIDKDVLNQVEGIHFNYGRLEPVVTSEKYARYYKYYQAIVGDPGDGYKGVPGIGKTKVQLYINEDMTEKELWDATVSCYASKGLSADMALATLRLSDMTQLTYAEKHHCSCSNFYKLKLFSPENL